jgi:hypothetical protein
VKIGGIDADFHKHTQSISLALPLPISLSFSLSLSLARARALSLPMEYVLSLSRSLTACVWHTQAQEAMARELEGRERMAAAYMTVPGMGPG